MKYIKIKNLLSLVFIAVLLSSCESTELDLVTDPNNLSVDQSDPNLVLNSVLLNFTGIWNGLNNPSRDLIRMENQFATYGDVVSVNTLDLAGGEYATSYRNFANIDLLEELNDSGSDLPIHVGIAKTIEAFNLLLLVDYLGDVPLSEANDPDIEEPSVDSGQDIYTEALNLLDEANNLLNQETINLPLTDFFYNGDAESWIRLGNTLRIRAFTNTRLVSPDESSSGINSILDAGNFINDIEEDFNFQYTQTGPPVESRHPFFVQNYLPGGAATYQSNYLVFLLKDSKAFEDPRLTYYLYRQTSDDPEGTDLPCDGNPSYDYCYLGDGYWARDHADNEGLPADGLNRATYGIYPGGGAFDDGQFVAASNSENAGGAGILPIFNSSFTHFLLAENALTNGVNGDPLDFLLIGIEQSMDKVSGFLGSPIIPNDIINDYLDGIELEYNNATSDEGRLFIIEREYFLALFGNGVEAYTMYKRTGMPINPDQSNSLSNIQSPVFPAGPFPRSFVFPQNVINNNQNIEQNSFSDRVFWDTNPIDFID